MLRIMLDRIRDFGFIWQSRIEIGYMLRVDELRLHRGKASSAVRKFAPSNCRPVMRWNTPLSIHQE